MGDNLQQLVADHMSQGIVDALEIVKVDIEKGGFFRPLFCCLQGSGQRVEKLRTVRQAGQVVEKGQLVQASANLAVELPFTSQGMGQLQHLGDVEGLFKNNQTVGLAQAFLDIIPGVVCVGRT